VPEQKEECATVCFSYFGVLSFRWWRPFCFLVLRSICNENSIVKVNQNWQIWNCNNNISVARPLESFLRSLFHPPGPRLSPHLQLFFLLFSPARFSMNSIANTSLSFALSLPSVSVEQIARVPRPNSQWIDIKSRRCDRSIYVVS